ncbi:MAG TPA: hypothetical protein VFD45_02725 [Patescibacteria group bacterium]|nr:hypothetical protein [Patescibacteria group bacterium]
MLKITTAITKNVISTAITNNDIPTQNKKEFLSSIVILNCKLEKPKRGKTEKRVR